MVAAYGATGGRVTGAPLDPDRSDAMVIVVAGRSGAGRCGRMRPQGLNTDSR